MDTVNKILENLLLVDESILSVAMVDMNGHTVSSKVSIILIMDLFQINGTMTMGHG